MAIRVQCPSCQKQLKAKDEIIGKRVKCPECQFTITVEAPVARAPIPATPASVSAPPVRASVVAAALPVVAAPPRPKRRPEPAPARTKLEGLSSGYRVDPVRWMTLALPHYTAVLVPTIAYLFLFSLLVAAWFGVCGVALALLSKWISETAAMVGAPFAWLPFVLLFPVFAIGVHVVCQKQIRGEPWTFGTFFSGFRWIGPLVGRALLLLGVELVTVLPSVAIGAAIGPQPEPILLGLASALALGCTLFGGYVFLRLAYFSHFLIIDRGCGPVESVRGSWILSRDHSWSLIGILLLTMAVLSLIPLLALGFNLWIPLPIYLLVPILLIGVIVQLIAFPAAVLFLNAGYLSIAGAKPLPGEPQNAGRTERRPTSILAWIPAGAVGVLVLLFGAGMTLLEIRERERAQAQLERKQQEALANAERFKQDQARARAAEAQARATAEEDAKELLAFFREGGIWSTELFDGNDPAAAVGSDFGGPAGAAPGIGPPGMGPGASGGGGDRPKVRVLVLGPRDLAKTKRPVLLGISNGAPADPRPVPADRTSKLGELAFAGSLLREAFARHFAEAMIGGDVEAVLVEAVLQYPSNGGAGGASGVGGPGSSGPGGPAGIGGPGGGPVGGPGSLPGVGPGYGGGIGDTGATSMWHGTTLPLDKASPLTREGFLKLHETRDVVKW